MRTLPARTFGPMLPDVILARKRITSGHETSLSRPCEVYGGRAQDLENYVTHNVMWYSTSEMASNVLETQASTESNRHGTNIVVVKGTAHARLKEIRAKATVIALRDSFFQTVYVKIG